ncbi:MAG: hypothetical protein Q4G09_02520 [Clostridia bacterium]|nr:hypothetical protein [Clostridia bacterium]
MELELKAKEYKRLCEKLKEKKIDSNYESLLELKTSFIRNQKEIVEINRQIKKLKENTI